MTTLADVDAVARSLPQVTVEGTPDRPAYRVKGKLFLVLREPRPDAVDPETGERYDDVLAIWVADEGEKEALLNHPSGAFFTTSHFDGYNAVLLRLAHLGRIGRDELAEIITDAWLCRAPKRLAKRFLESAG